MNKYNTLFINNIELVGGGRDARIDAAKGIAIILVVLGHIISSETFLYRFINSFHMPLFFTLSGLFVVKNLDMDFKTHFINRFRRLIIPYLIFGLFLITPFYWLYSITGSATQISLAQRWLAQMVGLGSDWGTEWTCYLWFLPCLFCTDLIIWSIWKYAYKYRYYLLAFVAFSGIVYYLTINKSLPFRLHTATIAIIFMSLGSFLKDRISRLSTLTIIACLVCYIICWHGNHFESIAMYINDYGLIYFSIPASIFVSIIVLFVSKYAAGIPYLSLLGKQSLMIYILQTVTMPVIGSISRRCGIFGKEMIEGPVMIAVAIVIALLCMKAGLVIQDKWPWMLGAPRK